MNKIFPVLLLFIAGCTVNNEITNKLDTYLEAQSKYYDFNGNVLVAEKGKIIYQRSFGLADYDSQRILNDSSVFELASVSKQFTATAILLLVDNGKLSLTDSLRKFFPELPYSNITIRHMLTHTSGLPDYFWLMIEKWDHSKIAFNKDMIALLAAEKLPAVFAPGTRWEYSNTAYVMLATIVENISEQSYKDYMAENIFTPLGMKHTRIYNTRRSLKDTIPNYAYGFIYNDSLKKFVLPDNDPDNQFVVYMDGIQGDGIVNSTTADLLKWDRAVKNHTLLTEATQKEMLKGQEILDTANKTYYGYGVMIGKNESGNFIAHSGGWPGYTTNLARYTDYDRTLIVLSNNNSSSPTISTALNTILSGKNVVNAYEHKEMNLDSTSKAKFIGSYTLDGKPAYSIELRNDSLFRVFPSGDRQEIKIESMLKLFRPGNNDVQFEMEEDGNGNLKYYSISYGVKKELKKEK